MAQVMDAGNETGSSTRDSQSHPVVDDEDELQQQQRHHGSPETYPKLRIRSGSGGNSFDLRPTTSSHEDDGSSKHSSLDHFDMDPEIIRRGISNKHSGPVHLQQVSTDPDSSLDNGSFKIDSGVIARNYSSDDLESSGSHVGSELPPAHDHENGSNYPTKFPVIKMGSSAASSSSSSSSSSFSSSSLVPPRRNDNDIDELDPRSHHDGDQLAVERGVSEQNTKPGEQEESSSLFPEIDGSPMTLTLLPTQSPPVQVMQRSEGYDPSRIPQSVFQRSSSDAQNDWSIASNESLFSIHVGTSSSFSREQALIISEARKSEENSKSNEVFSFTPPHPLGNPDNDSPNSPTAFPVAELVKADVVAAAGSDDSHSVVESQNKQIKAEKVSEITHAATMTQNAKRPAEEQRSNQKKVPTVSWRSTSVSNSDRSQNSTRSFAFPITKPSSTVDVDDGDGGEEKGGKCIIVSSRSKKDWEWSSFYCSNVSTWPWPSCYYRSCCDSSSSWCSWCKCCFNCSSWSSSCFSCKSSSSSSCTTKQKKCGWRPSSLSCCYCSNCSSICSFRYCVRPSCCCCCCTCNFCSSGSNCSWNYYCCYCWNCSSKKRWCCCHPSSTLSDEARLESAKKAENTEQNQEKAQQKKAKRHWYSFLCCSWKKCSCCSCFSWLRCSRCCHC